MIDLVLFFAVTLCEDLYEAGLARRRGETPARGHAKFQPLKMSADTVLKTLLLVGGAANSIGLAFILIINYVRFFVTGTVYYGYWDAGKEVWLYINMVFPLVVMMFLLPVFNRLYYKQSGNVLLGAVANCLIFIMMLLSASVNYIPM